MEDFVIASIAVHLAASKNRAYRESVYQIYHSLIIFLHENGLAVRELIAEGEKLDDDFIIRRSDLTAEGYEVIRKGLHKWVRGVTAGETRAEDTAVLTRELKRIRRP